MAIQNIEIRTSGSQEALSDAERRHLAELERLQRESEGKLREADEKRKREAEEEAGRAKAMLDKMEERWGNSTVGHLPRGHVAHPAHLFPQPAAAGRAAPEDLGQRARR